MAGRATTFSSVALAATPLSQGQVPTNYRREVGATKLLARNLTTDPLIDCGAGSDKADLDKLPKDPNSVISGCESKTRH